MTEYTIGYEITTKRLRSGAIRSKVCEDGLPIKADSLPLRYQETYHGIEKIQHQAVEKHADLESITTTIVIQ